MVMGVTDTPARATPRRRLYRSRNQRVIGGVCGGVSEYLNVDVVIARIIALAIAFTGGGALIYLIAWVVIPDEPRTPEEAPGLAYPVESPPPPERHDQTRWIIGGLLIAVGSWLVVRNIGIQLVPWFDDVVLPMVLIAIGTAVVVYAMRK